MGDCKGEDAAACLVLAHYRTAERHVSGHGESVKNTDARHVRAQQRSAPDIVFRIQRVDAHVEVRHFCGEQNGVSEMGWGWECQGLEQAAFGFSERARRYVTDAACDGEGEKLKTAHLMPAPTARIAV